MKRSLGVTLVLLTLLIAGCRIWDEPTTITRKDNSVIQCPRGVVFDSFTVITCNYDRGSAKFTWDEIVSISRTLEELEKKN